MKICFSSFSVRGRERPNQDAILEPMKVDSGFWCAIADGVGGRPNGDVASSLAVNSTGAFLSVEKDASILDVFNYVVAEFGLQSHAGKQEKTMATTLSILHLDGDRARVGHVGDSRVYHLRNRGILRRTKDQTEVQELLDRRVISKRQAARYQRKNVLNGYVSSGKELLIEEGEFKVEIGDRIVLLTDGVHSVVPMRLVRDISLGCVDVAEFVGKLQVAVEEAGVVDDYSALVLSIES